MKIVGFQKNSFVDFPGKIAAVIFLAGCDFDCWYCHNKTVCEDETGIVYTQQMILDFLEKRHGFVDGLVISGGEPLLNDDLLPFIKKVKDRRLLVKLDTNGANSDRLKTLLDTGFIDYVAMDIKAPYEKYHEIIQRDIDTSKIKKSIEILMNSKIDYEFRTTVVPEFSLEDIRDMMTMIAGAKKYVLQQYRDISDKDSKVIHLPHKKDFFIKAKEIAQEYVNAAIVKGM